ncbi:MAG TPA: hypothetical protein VN618_04495 [Solirubrobacteraceae bacterium]|nr:hypothetical protein [Solirubrobacteraceae bacterium]
MSKPESPAPARARAATLRLAAALAMLAAGLALVACGGSKPGDAAASEQARERRDEVKAAEFAKCLREHGMDATASSGGGGFRLQVRPKAGTGPPTMEAAQKACRKYQPEPKKVHLSPQEKVQREEEVLKFAKCMREHGVDIHADVKDGGIQIRVHGRPGSGPNPASPAFQAAQKACSGYLPFKAKGGPGAGRVDGPPSTSSSGGAGAAGASLAIGG